MTKIRNYNVNEYGVIVIGAGHAGCEAALASARMGVKTLLLTMNLDSIAMMPCNPSIGGTGKGHLVREIDALGGEMGLNIDKTMIQSKMLNTGKGPAVHSLRAQADKNLYHQEMKKTIELQENLTLRQAEVIDLIFDSGDQTNSEYVNYKSVVTRTAGTFKSECIVIATGTYLAAKIFIGHENYESGPSGLSPSVLLADRLKALDFDIRRFKTGTPARVHRKSLDFSKMEVQNGDDDIVPFSFMNDSLKITHMPCYLTYTNAKTHQIIQDNIHLSAMFSGQIEGVVPRYCPSIEDKINRFADRERHQLFIEPEGLNTDEMYVQGMSSSLPETIQEAFMRSIPGMETCQIMRPAHAIEYDCINPLELLPTLEMKKYPGIFTAGQFNGSSGYEEAASQGLVAGINAALKIKGEDSFILDRSQAYIGVLIDDLVTKGTDEPYRIMTGRCEYRLLLRQDNADQRLTQIGYNLGLVTEERYQKYRIKTNSINDEMNRLKQTKVRFELINQIFSELGQMPISQSMTLYELLKRPEVNYQNTAVADISRPLLHKSIFEQCEIQIKYEGYIRKQVEQVKHFYDLEKKVLPSQIDYHSIDGLRIEARQKLTKIQPTSIGQASRISGVSPADISVLLVYLEQRRRRPNA